MTTTVNFLGTHEPSWLRTAGVPLFISHRRLMRLKRTLPVAIAPFALDSGGFSELSLFGGWKTTPSEYVDAVIRYDREIGQLQFAAPQDYMCEPEMLQRTGLKLVEHQQRTVANYLELHKLWGQRSPEECPFIPVLQGYDKEDYLRCIDMYGEAGVDLSRVPLVGVGTVCRRQHTEAIGDVVDAILDTDPLLPLHLFGVKTLGLKLYGHKAASVDSLGWSYNARRNPKLPECQHASCNNCMKWALRWRRNIVGGAWCSRHGEWCAGFGGGYCGDFVAPQIGGAEISAWLFSEPDKLAG